MTNPNKVGLIIGGLLGGSHLFWSLLVLLSWAQPALNFIFWMHMIRSIYVVKAFDPIAALTLVLVTTAMGYGFGYLGAKLWPKSKRPSNRTDSAYPVSTLRQEMTEL